MNNIKRYHWSSFYFIFVVIGLFLTWFYQQSINAYWQQTYHTPSVLTHLENMAWWNKGAEWKNTLEKHYQHWQQQFEHHLADAQQRLSPAASPIHNENERGVENTEMEIVQAEEGQADAPLPEVASTEETTTVLQNTVENQGLVEVQGLPVEHTPAPVEEKSTAKVPQPATAIAQSPPQAKPQSHVKAKSKVLLHKQDMVFFAGDSLMQGVAPYAAQWLTTHNVKSLNLSKQNTGLSYPSFFDWPATIEQNLAKYPQIKLLVVFLGPNDPWNFPNPAKPSAKYLKFKSPEWESVYRQRVKRILNAADKHNVRVIWLQIPYMKSKKLNEQMHYLNSVLEKELAQRTIFIPMREILSGGKKEYRESIQIGGKNTRVRSKDGIHFTLPGMKFIAEQISHYIEIR